MSKIEDLSELTRGMYFRRDGTPYRDILEFAKEFEKSDRQVRRTKLWWGGLVSTVWLGLNHNYFGGPPLIFETMVFPPGRLDALDMERYSTEEEAIDGHNRFVRAWQFKLHRVIWLYMRALWDHFS